MTGTSAVGYSNRLQGARSEHAVSARLAPGSIPLYELTAPPRYPHELHRQPNPFSSPRGCTACVLLCVLPCDQPPPQPRAGTVRLPFHHGREITPRTVARAGRVRDRSGARSHGCEIGRTWRPPGGAGAFSERHGIARGALLGPGRGLCPLTSSPLPPRTRCWAPSQSRRAAARGR